jgi:iron(III) transport system permease protein
MVIPPGRTTLTIRIYNYLHFGASDAVSGLCVLLILLVILFGVIASLFLTRKMPLAERAYDQHT